jgi:trans-2,3-dihydro-3-hydroxyanthranilate isomerase
VHRNATGAPCGATITAPQPLTLGDELSVGTLGACAGLRPSDILVRRHEPRFASTGVPYVIAEVGDDALTAAVPDVAAFRRATARHTPGGELSIYLYARSADRLRARMFSPLSGTTEDAATGSAATTLGAMLLSLDGSDHAQFDILQGVEMGRPSRLHVTARRSGGSITASVGGTCVPVMHGEITL